MTRQQTIHTRIMLIHALKSLCNEIPVHSLIREVARLEKGTDNEEVMAVAEDLRRQGLAKVGRTVNDHYVRLTTFKKEQSMKHFEEAIKAHLDELAEKDTVFAEKYKAEGKSISDCCKYILSEIRKLADNGMYGCKDEVVYGLAIHYYDESSITAPSENIACTIVTNREMSEEDKKRAEEEAQRIAYEREVERQVKKIEAQKEAEAKRAETARRKAMEKAEQKRQESEATGQLSLF